MIIKDINQFEKTNISLKGQPLSGISQHNSIYAFIDDILEFDAHINKLCSIISQSIKVLDVSHTW